MNILNDSKAYHFESVERASRSCKTFLMDQASLAAIGGKRIRKLEPLLVDVCLGFPKFCRQILGIVWSHGLCAQNDELG